MTPDGGHKKSPRRSCMRPDFLVIKAQTTAFVLHSHSQLSLPSHCFKPISLKYLDHNSSPSDVINDYKMPVCLNCEELTPRPKKCARRKKPVNCGGPCLTAYVEEHIVTWQGKKVESDKGLAEKLSRGGYRGQIIQGMAKILLGRLIPGLKTLPA